MKNMQFPLVPDSSVVRMSTIYQDSSSVVLQANVNSSDPDLSVRRVSCVNMNTGKNCSDNVDVFDTNNNGKSATIGFSNLQPEELYKVTIIAGNKKIEDLVANKTFVCMGELNFVKILYWTIKLQFAMSNN